MKEKIALFIDGANLAGSLNKSDVRVDYRKFMRDLNETYDVILARYYSGVSDHSDHQSIRDFVKSLGHRGLTPITKPVRTFPDGKVKADMDVEIAVDMIRYASLFDRVVLFSGDGDFTYAVKALKEMGVKVTICGDKFLTSTNLRKEADEFINLFHLAKQHDK